MKRKWIFLYLFLCVGVYAFAVISDRWLILKDVGAGSTLVWTPNSSEYLVIKEILFLTTNAAAMYFYTGSKTACNKVTPFMSFSAKAGWDKKDLNMLSPKGQPLYVWFSADPDTDLAVALQKENA